MRLRMSELEHVNVRYNTNMQTIITSRQVVIYIHRCNNELNISII